MGFQNTRENNKYPLCYSCIKKKDEYSSRRKAVNPPTGAKQTARFYSNAKNKNRFNQPHKAQNVQKPILQ